MLCDVIKDWGGLEVTPMQAYADIYRLGSGYLQKENEPPGKFKSNPIAYWKNHGSKSGHFRIMFEDTFEEVLKELQAADFAILSGCTYFGRRNVQSHASKMYMMPIDLDGVTDESLNNFFSGAINGGAYPVPKYMALSGHGVHLYYIFEEPLPLFPNIKLQLKNLKYALTDKIWNSYTSTIDKVQHQGINQGFRVFGGKTKKNAEEKIVRVFKIHDDPNSLEQLSEMLPDEFNVDERKLFKESKYTLQEAKEKFPEWYERVVLNKEKRPKKWEISEKVHGDNPYALYDWWLRKLKAGAEYGRRYFNIMCLFIYAVKCDVDEEKAWKDACDLIPFMNSLNPEEPFTIEDVESAFECYDDKYATFPIKDISKISGIEIIRNKRNYRKQDVHLERARAVQMIDYPNREWINKDGAPTKQDIVEEWRKNNPDGRKADCIRDTGLSKPTVYKWWDGEEAAQKVEKKKENEIKYEVEFPDGKKGFMTKEEVAQYNISTGGWHKELPEYYVVEGDPNMLIKMNEYAKMGVRTLDVLTKDEYEYLLSKAKK